jgi:hypothetical protein
MNLNWRWLGVVGGIGGAEAAPDFRKDINPIFKKHCWECHSEEAKKEKSGLVFDNLKRFATDIGPASQIVPGEVEGSNLWEVINLPLDDDRHMPPRGELSDKEKKLVAEWIQAGAALDKKNPTPPPVPKSTAPPVMSWTNTEGKKITAEFVKLDGETLHLKMAGKPYAVALDKLDVESQEQARLAAGAAADAAAKP